MSRKRNSYTIENKIEVLKWHRENGGVFHQTSRKFGIDRKSIKEWLKREDSLEYYDIENIKKRRRFGSGKKPLYEEIDKELCDFIKSKSENGLTITNRTLCEEAKQIAFEKGFTNFKGSAHYIANFKKRSNISETTSSVSHKVPLCLQEVKSIENTDMEKESKKKNRKDVVNITKIYETIKDKGFIQDLWLDVMSDLKEKPSYARLKNMVEKVIESAVDNYATKPKDHEERLKTRTIFTDLSIMTFTIDTLISELLHKKLKDEFKTIISNIVEDLKNKDSQPKQEPKNIESMLENVEEFLCNGTEEKTENKSSNGSTGTPGESKIPNKRISATDDLHVDNLRKELRSKTGEHSIDIFNSNTVALSIVETETEESSSTILNKNNLKNSIPDKNRKRKLPAKFRKKRKTVTDKSDISSEENTDVDIMNVSDDDALSFVGNCSVSSVSSVHTSDLSSFEDDVSISSEDEKGRKTKKFVPLKLAKEYFNKDSTKKLQIRRKKKAKLQEPSKFSESTKLSKDSPNKRLSGRTRKPNSKYASDDVICTLRQILPQADSTSEKSEDDISKEIFCDIKSEKTSTPIVKKGNRGRPRKSTPFHIKAFDQASEDSSDTSEEGSVVKKDFHITKKDVSLKESSEKISSTKNRTTVNAAAVNPQDMTQTNGVKKKIHMTSPTPLKSGTEKVPNILHKHKRGRPSKADLALRNDKSLTKSILLASDVSLNKQNLQNNEQKVFARKSEPQPIHKKGTLVNTKEINNESFKHSVESFSILEESLCLKDKQVNQQNSPSKSSTKSYQTSDLYKPRSDFRVSFNSRGSKALTLFSN